ncbi:MAG TPA: helix-turn-helix domain-containing protein [Gemmatimonadaceae bacterium]|jgi:AcrR family transcriptional regulator|nr:helix-turn-helix domain-containing protein [Gemmatimonadaceae bacterium]
MASRQKLLAAAARIYGESGFRGATTRRIADEAGVNEVTLFRLFGSKSALIAEALREHAPRQTDPVGLPDEPTNPEQELSAWCDVQLAHLRAARSMIRKAMGEIEEHPEMAPCMSEGTQGAFQELRAYGLKLKHRGAAISDAEVSAAAAMLISALFADAMGREMMPTLYPQPETDAAALYARLFLRAVGCGERQSRTQARPTPPHQRPRGARSPHGNPRR